MAALLMSLFLLFFGIQQQEPPSPGNLSGDPNAILLHELMMATLHEAKSLSFESTHCLYSVKDGDKQHSSTSNYKAWLMKPNYARLEVYRRGQDLYGVLVGDGDFFWLYWPNGTAFFTSAYTGVQGETEHNVYMKKPTPVGMHSLAHEICYLGASGMSVLELSSFHRYVDSLNPYLEEIKSEGEEEIAGTACDVIRLRFMKGQRERLLWLSRQDHLPRKLREIVHVSYDIFIEEEWTHVRLNGELDPALFAWTPPDGWERREMPDPDDALLKLGDKAPDFSLMDSKGSRITLADYHGKPVWLMFWRVG